MNKVAKINFLYGYAHGNRMPSNAEEKALLRKYKVTQNDGNYATKSNIIDYVEEVDKGYPFSFYDWCMSNCKADRRRKGSSEAEMKSQNRMDGVSGVLLGWLVWGMAIYWMLDGAVAAGTCAILGAIVAAVLSQMFRRSAGFTLFLLPIILAACFGS